MWQSFVLFYSIYFLLFPAALSANELVEPVYKAVGGEVVLVPGSVTGIITSITWKHGADMAALWDAGGHDYYRQFKDHSKLDNITGELTITGLNGNHSGSYSYEINNKATGITRLLVISPVHRPSLSTWCHPEKTYCLFTCEGETTDAQPIVYVWGASDMRWQSTKVINKTKEFQEKELQCSLKNPVSIEDSNRVRNPLYICPYRFILLITVAGLFMLVCVSLCIVCQCRKGKNGGGYNVEAAQGQHGENVAEEMQVMLQETPLDSAHPVTCNGTEDTAMISKETTQNSASTDTFPEGCQRVVLTQETTQL